MNSIDTERLALLGQITIMRRRLDRLEQELDKPFGSDLRTEGFVDAKGNIAFQTGMLMGQLQVYDELLK